MRVHGALRSHHRTLRQDSVTVQCSKTHELMHSKTHGSAAHPLGCHFLLFPQLP